MRFHWCLFGLLALLVVGLHAAELEGNEFPSCAVSKIRKCNSRSYFWQLTTRGFAMRNCFLIARSTTRLASVLAARKPLHSWTAFLAAAPSRNTLVSFISVWLTTSQTDYPSHIQTIWETVQHHSSPKPAEDRCVNADPLHLGHFLLLRENYCQVQRSCRGMGLGWLHDHSCFRELSACRFSSPRGRF